MDWQGIRQIAIYPAMFVFGIVWSVLYVVRWHACPGRCPGNIGSAALGAAVALWAASGFFAIWITELTGVRNVSGGMFTAGAVVVVIVLIIGITRMTYKIWRNGEENAVDDMD